MYENVVSTEEVMGGEPRVKGTRISVRQIADMVDKTATSPEGIANRFDISEVAVYEALAYYHRKPEEFLRIRGERQEKERERSDEMITSPEDIATVSDT